MSVYDNMKFPSYQFVEFPKWVKDVNGKEVVVETAEEEAEVTGANTAVVEPEAGAEAPAGKTGKTA